MLLRQHRWQDISWLYPAVRRNIFGNDVSRTVRINRRPEAGAGARCRAIAERLARAAWGGCRAARIYTYIDRRARPFYRRHRTSTARVRPGAFLLDATRSADDDTSAAAATHRIIFYTHRYIRGSVARSSRLLVAKGYAALFTLEIYKSLYRASPRRYRVIYATAWRERTLSFSACSPLTCAPARFITIRTVYTAYNTKLNWYVYIPKLLTVCLIGCTFYTTIVCTTAKLFKYLYNSTSILLQKYISRKY